MSHIVTIRTQVRDPLAVQAACLRLRLPTPIFGPTKLFINEKTGWAVRLNGWNYPVVFNTQSGEVNFDNYEGKWGNPKELDSFLQGYAVEKAKLEARKSGYTATEHELADGSIRVCVQVA